MLILEKTPVLMKETLSLRVRYPQLQHSWDEAAWRLWRFRWEELVWRLRELSALYGLMGLHRYLLLLP